MPDLNTRYTQVPRATLWLVEGDEFLMGSEEPGEGPPFVIEVGSFYISKGVITNEQYAAFRPEHVRSPLASGDDDPAVGVSFVDAAAYCDWYAQLSRKRFRLPTEAEWEFACRGRTTSRCFFGNSQADADLFVWHRNNSGGHCHAIESAHANPMGLHEMLGNVWEWTASLYRPYPIVEGDGRDEREAPGPRMLRGGSFRSDLSEIGSAVRRAEDPEARHDDVGFRIVRAL